MPDFSQIASTYTGIQKIGEGSGGIAYKAYHERLKIPVVLKEVKHMGKTLATSRQEVDILKNLKHPYLPQVYDFLELDGSIYTVMSFIPGKSFQTLLDEGQHFSQAELIIWARQLLSALHYLHTQTPPIIHSDIKPANLMLTPQGNICLIDFNISFFLDGKTLLGYTHGYSSPEQKRVAMSREHKGVETIDVKTDIYSVGATFYHLATGTKMADAGDFALLSQCTSEAFSRVIEKATSKNKNTRYASALKMFAALGNIRKQDQRYRHLTSQHHFIQTMLVLVMAVSIVVVGYGFHSLQLERTQSYNLLVESQMTNRENGQYDAENANYLQAIALKPESIEAYYQHACALYEQEKYQECIDFVNYDVNQNEKLDLTNPRVADIGYIQANSYFELGDYEHAITAYEKLFTIGGFYASYYRDYAITLAYAGNLEKANDVLAQAIDYGLTDDSVYFAKGEISASQNMRDDALKNFELCIEETEDTDLKARAYLMSAKLYERFNENAKIREILLEAKDVLPMSSQLMILQKLIQADIDLGDTSGETSYYEEAVTLSESLISQKWATRTTYNNLAILHQKLGQLDEAEASLETMKDLYGEDYNLYKRYAFIELDRQALKENLERDYAQFAAYYEKAMALYDGNNADAEMALLQTQYAQVQEGGWLS